MGTGAIIRLCHCQRSLGDKGTVDHNMNTTNTLKCEMCAYFKKCIYRSVNCVMAQIANFMGPTWAHLGPVGPRWAPCWPHEPCYQGTGRKNGTNAESKLDLNQQWFSAQYSGINAHTCRLYNNLWGRRWQESWHNYKSRVLVQWHSS